jgi:hypothetical protein
MTGSIDAYSHIEQSNVDVKYNTDSGVVTPPGVAATMALKIKTLRV